MSWWEVYTGKDADAAESVTSSRMSLLATGCASLTIPLNGGSQTRRDVRDGWREFARARNLKFSCIGNCMVIIGGRA